MRNQASILHLDLDAFYAAVEQRDKPSLRGKPVIVGGTGQRGVVATASYEARQFGVRSAMSTAEARARCPHAAFLAGRFDAYRATSTAVMTALGALSPLVEPLSLDEAYVDLAASADGRTLDPAQLVEIGAELKRSVHEATGGLTASVGIATSKLIAKIASELEKPDGLVVVAPGEEHNLLRPMPVSVIPGVGPATAERLRRIGVQTVEQLEQVSQQELIRTVGQVHGASLYLLARADDSRPVVADRETKSISVEDTFERDLVDPVLLASIVDRHARSVCQRLAKAKLSGRTVTLKVRLYDFTTSTRSASLTGPTDQAAVVSRIARGLLADVDTSGGVRLLGVGVSGLADWIQDDLFDEHDHTDDFDDSQGHVAASHQRSDAPQRPRWVPGLDVEHHEHGPGWVWGSGLGRVTVRFETAETGPGPVLTFRDGDPALRPRADVAEQAAHAAQTSSEIKLRSTVPSSTSTPTHDDPAAGSDHPRTPPEAAKVPIERSHHGDVFVDDYEWLRDKHSPQTLAYLEAENAYTAAQTAHLADLREAIFTEIKTRTQETDLSVPSRTGSYWYYSRTTEGQQYQILCRCPAAAGDDWTPPDLQPGVDIAHEQILLDCNGLAADHDFFSLGAVAVSVDEQLLAYSTDLTGAERYTIQVKDLRTGTLLPDSMENTLHNVTWSIDGSQLFYSTVDEAWRPDKVWRHALGSDSSTDVLVYEEIDERFGTAVTRTTSDRFLVISAASKVTSEHRLLDADDPLGEFRVVVPRETGVEYDLEHAVIRGEDRLFVLHNKGALNFTLGMGPVTLTSLDQLGEVIPGSDSVRLSDLSTSATTLAVNIREGGLPQVRTFALTGVALGAGTNIEFDEQMFNASAIGFSDWRQPFVRLAYSSWLTPATVLDYDPGTGERHIRKQQPVLGGYDPADYVQTREWVTARDGALVPISVVHHKHVTQRSDSPLLLYGYGSYEISIDPHVSIARLSLLDRGMVFVLAHVRGGGEMGRTWYEQGKLLHKKNTFTDFVAAAEHLVETGWTSPKRMVAMGGSAGGLLMGAVANAAPGLFAGIVAQVPFVDALTTVLDPSLPLTVIEWDEWGDPLHDPEVYAYIKSYTPYENVEALAYPAIYSITSLHDTRVLYVEPAKWTAKLRATATGERPILLKCEMAAGHGGVSGRYDAWREAADCHAWVIDVSGASKEQTSRSNLSLS